MKICVDFYKATS